MTYLSLVGLGSPAIVKDTITLPTQVATLLTEDQSLCLPIIMVVTQWLQGEWGDHYYMYINKSRNPHS